MRPHNLSYLIREGVRNIVHNKLMSFACIGVLMACLLLIGGAAMISLNVNAIFNFVEDQNEVTVYLEDTLSPSDLEIVALQVTQMDNVAQYDFVSKEEALAEQIALLGPDGEILAGLEGEENPLPNKYIIQVADLALLEDTAARLREIDGVHRVSAPTEVAAILVGVRQIIAVAGSAVVLILIVVSIVIITSTIKLTIYSRRREISIMRYVGATDTFIRMPFLVEGMFIGLIAAVLAFLTLGFGYTYLIGWIDEHFGQYLGTFFTRTVDFWTIAHYIFAGFAGLGVTVGVLGSGIFVRKYMKV